MKRHFVVFVAVAIVSILGFGDSAQAFGPCLKKMPKEVSYIPKLAQCGGKAAVVVAGSFYNSFSIVARDCANGDRDPCHRQIGGCGTNASSPFKVQKIINASVVPLGAGPKVEAVPANIHCLKEAGDSLVYKLLVRRITIKLRNPARNPNDIAKICLPSRAKAINPIEIRRVGAARGINDSLGITRACYTQGYLNCPFYKSHLCDGR